MKRFYQNKHNYEAILIEASKNIEAFSESEINAIRGAYWVLVYQEGKVSCRQKNVGNHSGEVKIDVSGYTIYVGNDNQKESMFVDVRVRPLNWINEYHICGDRPIRIIWEPNKQYCVWKYDWNTGDFVSGMEYAAEVWMSTGDVEEIGEEQFFIEVEKLRKKLGVQEQFQGKVETLPSPGLMEAVNRISALEWEQEYIGYYWQIQMVHEFLRRITKFGNDTGVKGVGQCISMLEEQTKDTVLNNGHPNLVISQIPNERNRKVCLWYLQWMVYCHKMGLSVSAEVEQNPFEPLIFLFERGVHFGQEQGELLKLYECSIFQSTFGEVIDNGQQFKFDYNTLEALEQSENYFSETEPKLSVDQILDFEKTTGFLIPFEYKELLLLYNGGHPKRCDFYSSLYDRMDSVGRFHGISSESKYNLDWICLEYLNRIPSDLFPVAGVGGSMICLGTRGKYEGKVCYWDSEEEEESSYKNVIVLESSFEEFIQKLR